MRREAAAHAGTYRDDGGAKKHRRLPSARAQRRYSPSGEGCTSENGIVSQMSGAPLRSRTSSVYHCPSAMTSRLRTIAQSRVSQHSSAASRGPARSMARSCASALKDALWRVSKGEGGHLTMRRRVSKDGQGLMLSLMLRDDRFCGLLSM